MTERVAVKGPLSVHAAGFAAELVELGYRPRSVGVQLRLLADLSRWLAEEDVALVALTGQEARRFLGVRRQRYVDLAGARALGPLLGYLRELGAVPGPRLAADSPVERLLDGYREYLARERGLVASSIDGHERAGVPQMMGIRVTRSVSPGPVSGGLGVFRGR